MQFVVRLTADPGGHKFESQLGHITSTQIDHEIISVVILFIPLIQRGQLLVTGESICRSTC